MILKYISLFVFISGLIIWSMIGIAKIRASLAPIAVVPALQTNIATTNKIPIVPVQDQAKIVAVPLSPVAPNSPAPLAQAQPTAKFGTPKTLMIPKIGVNATIESVGLDPAGRMAVPKNWFNVGWYNLGFRVGDNGSAVIDGHLDTVTGAGATFYRLGNLIEGDLVTVLDDQGKSYNFKVVSKQSYDFDKMPLETIFASKGTPGLNLITCSGSWDKVTRNYTQRLVVYTRME